MVKTKLYRVFFLTLTLGLYLTNLSSQIIYSNNGTKSGVQFNIDDGGSVTEVSTPNFGGANALRCRVEYDPNITERYHAGFTKKGGLGKRNQERWYGFAVYFPSNWETVDNGFSIWQTIANYGGSAGFKPNAFFNTFGSKWSMTLFHGPVQVSNRAKTRFDLGVFPKGQWVKVVINAVWKDDNSGRFRIWLDDVLKLDHTGPNCFSGEDEEFRLDHQIYATGWFNNGLIGTQTSRDVFFDRIKIGDGTAVYNDVVPTGTPVGEGGGGSSSLTFEAENVSSNSGGASTNQNGAGTVVNLLANGTGDWVEFTLPNIQAGTYGISVNMQKYGNGGRAQSSINGTNQGSVFDTYNGASTTDPFSIGSKTFGTTGNKTIRFTVTGKNSGSTGFKIGIDKIILTASGGTPLRASVSSSSNSDGLGTFSYYPNPVRGRVLNLVGPVESPTTEVNVYDLQGRLVKSSKMSDRSHSIDLNGLQPGMYLLQYRSLVGEKEVRKIILE